LPSPEDLKYKILIKNKTCDFSKDTEIQVAPLLSSLVSVIPIKFDDFYGKTKMETGINQEVCSLSEVKAEKISKTEGHKLLECNKTKFSRIYPKAVRVDSRFGFFFF